MTTTMIKPAAEPRAPRRRLERLMPYLLLAPALITLIVLLGYPAVSVLTTSFRELGRGELVRGEVVWTGFDNYVEVLGDSEFWMITLRTVLFTATCVALTIGIALLLALLMRRLPGGVRLLLQVSLLLAWAMPQLSATTVFQWIFDQNYGILNKTLVAIGFEGFERYSWFTTGLSTMAIIATLIVWQAVPFVAMTLYAALVGIPQDQYESAGLDGASAWQTFRNVTLPPLAPMLALVTFMSILWDFKVFAQVWAFRQGGPNGGSTTLPVLQYVEGIARGNFGVAAAISVLMVIVLMAISAQYLRLLLRSQGSER
ncbi:N,N'-diacetylchitobiose transport system permease protein [Actinoalloteichus hoggarensis]|uniref:Inner membrane ABC transporter permease protein YcjO n=1 Tax=Actinoalloteichus hoggarensis TaxID=1470176 RepID=A0A221VX22_9PSEU|nr:sugar ABC transporter permease [Actinoalloteichus hoggarensis]ASO18053.1 Inner membrane ABC transporter permease protein YcjO [Actinoalloteichus hoggarensis]MBB5921409.1 N,N'-diacetylchitobiose transport system permease protein [Actinoalloteichus hoggarensis]